MTRSGPQWHVIRQTVRNSGKTVDLQMDRERQREEDSVANGQVERTHTHKHTHTDPHTHTHRHRGQAGRQTGRARNEPGQEIRFLGGFAMGTGLQSTAAQGRGRSRVRCRGGGDGGGGQGWRYQAGAGAGLSERAVWESDFHHCPPSLPPSLSLSRSLSAVVRHREGKQQEEKQEGESRKSPEKKGVSVWVCGRRRADILASEGHNVPLSLYSQYMRLSVSVCVCVSLTSREREE